MKTALFLLLFTTNALAYSPDQVEKYVKRVFRGQKNQCVPMAKMAKEELEKSGYTCTYGSELKHGKHHRFVIAKMNGIKTEILH